MSFETVRYTPEWRASLVALLARVGTTQLTDEEFTWWFDRNPGGEGIVSLAVDQGEVVGVAAMSFFRTALEGATTRLAIPVNVATDPRYREMLDHLATKLNANGELTPESVNKPYADFDFGQKKLSSACSVMPGFPSAPRGMARPCPPAHPAAGRARVRR